MGSSCFLTNLWLQLMERIKEKKGETMAWSDFTTFVSEKFGEYKEEIKEAKELQDNQKKFNEGYVSKEKREQMEMKGMLKDVEDLKSGGSSESSNESSDGNFTGGTNEEIAWNFFVSKGYTKKVTAGIMGNFQQESGVDPKAIQSGGKGPGTGLIQWGNGQDGGRWNELVSWAKKGKKDEWDIKTQLEYLYIEMEQAYHIGLFKKNLSTKGYSAGSDALAAFKKVDNIEHGVFIFEETIERAGDPQYPKRIKYATDFYNKYKDAKFSTSEGGSGKLANPTKLGTVTSPYGMRLHPIQKIQKMHKGIDVVPGGNILAAADGTVVSSTFNDGGYGYYVVIDHGKIGGKNIKTLSAHMQKGVKVSAGDKVTQGQTIGIMGTTGGSTGVHLHFEVKENDANVDPQNYVKY